MAIEKNESDEVRISDDHKIRTLGVIEEKLRNMSSSDQEFRFLHKLLHKTRYFEEELKHLASSSSSTFGQVDDDRQFELQLRNKIQMAKQKFLSSTSNKRNSGTLSNSNHQLANKNESQSSSLNLSSKLDQSNKKSGQTGKETATAVQLYRHIDTMKWIRFLSRNTLGKMDPFWSILLLVGGSSIATFGQLLRLLAANRRVSERNYANSSGPNGQVLFRSRL